MASCIVCNQVNVCEPLDNTMDSDQTLRQRLQKVLGEAVIRDGWMCSSCQFDLRQIETYYSLLTGFRQRYMDTYQKWRLIHDHEVGASISGSLLHDTAQFSSESLRQLSASNCSVGSLSMVSQGVTDSELKVETCISSNQITSKHIKNEDHCQLCSEDDFILNKEVDKYLKEAELEYRPELGQETTQFQPSLLINEDSSSKRDPVTISLKTKRTTDTCAVVKRQLSAEKDYQFKCNTCDKCFIRFVGLSTHMRRAHKVEAKKSKGFNQPKENSDGSDKLMTQEFPCERTTRNKDTKLEKSEVMKLSMRIEGRDVHKSVGNDSDFPTHVSNVENTCTVTSPKKELAIEDDHPFKCVTCAKAFKHFSDLNTHMHMAHNDQTKLKGSNRLHKMIPEDSNKWLPIACHSNSTAAVENSTPEKTMTVEESVIVKGEVVYEQVEDDYENYNHMEDSSSHVSDIEYTGTVTSANDDHSEKACHPFQCVTCGKSFKRNLGLAVHMRMVHKDQVKKIKISKRSHKKLSDDSDEWCPGKNGHANLATVNSKIVRSFNCCICNEIFPRKKILYEHMSQAHNTKPHFCEMCKKEFNTSYKLKLHMAIHAKRKYRCQFCEKLFFKKTTLRAHESCEHACGKTIECSICHKKVSTLNGLSYHMKMHRGEKHHVCVVCGHAFISSINLRVHMRTHTGEKPYTCRVCNKCFSHITNFKNHEALHLGLKPYKCNFCDKSYCTGKLLKNHTKVHTCEKVLCNVCGKGFVTKSMHTLHMRLHTGERPFACEICDERFPTKFYLKRHSRKHVEPTIKYICETCGKIFTNPDNLYYHAATHRERKHICAVCNYAAMTAHSLKRHMRSHTGEKPYVCDICGRGFSLSANLQQHKQIHTDERPFPCTTCGIAFRDKGTLRRHLKRQVHQTKLLKLGVLPAPNTGIGELSAPST